MKRIIYIFLASLVLFEFGGCSSEPSSKSETNIETQLSSSTDATNIRSDEQLQGNVAGIGETLDYNGLKFTLDSAIQYEDTNDFPLDKADEGNIFIVMNFTVSNDTNADGYINMFNEDSYCDDVAIKPESMMAHVKGETLWGDVAQGKKRKGYIAYQVPTEWQTLEFHYSPDIGGSAKMMFKITPKDISK